MITKVAAYIFRRGNPQNELLVFAHRDYPDVPIQVPGGTVDEGETVVEALWREIKEESGLTDLTFIRKVGTYRFFWQEINGEVERHFFLVEAATETPDTWEHEVRGEGIDCGLVFSYQWAVVNEKLKLAGDLGRFLNLDDTPEFYGLTD